MQQKITQYGLLAGAATIAYFLLFYAFSKYTMLQHSVMWSSLAIYIVAMIKIALDMRREVDPAPEFKGVFAIRFWRIRTCECSILGILLSAFCIRSFIGRNTKGRANQHYT